MSRCEQGGFELVVQREGGGDLENFIAGGVSPVGFQDVVADVLRLVDTDTIRGLDNPYVEVVKHRALLDGVLEE